MVLSLSLSSNFLSYPLCDMYSVLFITIVYTIAASHFSILMLSIHLTIPQGQLIGFQVIAPESPLSRLSRSLMSSFDSSKSNTCALERILSSLTLLGNGTYLMMRMSRGGRQAPT